MAQPLRVFITYSHVDSELEEELKNQLAELVEEGLITIWDDTQMLPGDIWERVIINNVADSDILLYLVSAASLDSTNCNRELAEALNFAIRVVPIILEECQWQDRNIAGFHGLPERGRPISQWENQSSAWQSVVDGIRRLANALPSPAELSFNQGVFFQGVGELERSIQRYSRAIRLNPSLSFAYTNRGLLYTMKRDYASAIADLDKAIELNPNDAKAYGNRGNARGLSMGFNEQAIEDYNKAIELNPNDSDLYQNRGNARSVIDLEDLAMADFSKAIELNPTSYSAYLGRGISHAKMGLNDLAMADFNKSIELNPTMFLTYNNRGNIYKMMNNFHLSIEDYSKAIELAPDYADAYENRGKVYRMMGNNDLAQADFDKADQLRKDLPRLRQNLYISEL